MPRFSRELFATLTALAVGTGALTSCSSWQPPREAGAIALVVGGRANMPKPQLVAKAREYFRESVLSQDQLLVVGVSGKPDIQLDRPLDSKCNSESGCDAVVADYEEMLNTDVFDVIRAETPEADTLGAILLAAEALGQSDKKGPKRIVVIDSAVQTAGDLRLQAPGALGTDAAAVVKQLGGGEGKLKPLAGKDVLLTGLGSAADPQPALSTNEANQLKSLWTTVLSAGGAKVVVDLTSLVNTPPLDKLPKVTPMLPPPPVNTGTPTACVRFREDQVGFQPNSPAFVDPTHTAEVLGPIAATLREKNIAVTVTGTTALPEDPPFELSTARAEAVAKELANQKVPTALIKTAGVGTNFKGYAPPVDAAGAFIETLAVQYRLVIIAPVGQSCS